MPRNTRVSEHMADLSFWKVLPTYTPAMQDCVSDRLFKAQFPQVIGSHSGLHIRTSRGAFKKQICNSSPGEHLRGDSPAHAVPVHAASKCLLSLCSKPHPFLGTGNSLEEPCACEVYVSDHKQIQLHCPGRGHHACCRRTSLAVSPSAGVLRPVSDPWARLKHPACSKGWPILEN